MALPFHGKIGASQNDRVQAIIEEAQHARGQLTL